MTMLPEQSPEPASDAYRQQQLAIAVQKEVARGGRVESQGPYNAIIRKGKGTNHVLHLILTLVTLGFWGLVWITLAIVNRIGQGAIALTVDLYGNVQRQRV